MSRYKKHLDKFSWYDIEADTDKVTGKRVYHTPAGDAPSVTTILSTLPNPELDAWRERVGEEEANRISKEATDIGTLMHDYLEAHLLEKKYIPNPECNPDLYLDTALQMGKTIQLFGWRRLNQVWCVEIPLHFEDLYAGRTDLVGVYDRRPSIMDYKTSKYEKPDEHLKKYRLQMAFYALAFEHMFGQRIDYGVNFFAIRPSPEFRKPAESKLSIMDEAMMKEYKLKAVDVLFEYYDGQWTDSKLIAMDKLVTQVEQV